LIRDGAVGFLQVIVANNAQELSHQGLTRDPATAQGVEFSMGTGSQRNGGQDLRQESHPRKAGKGCYKRYWRKVDGRVRFSDGVSVLSFHQTTTVSRCVKVQNVRSPYEDDWVY
jgi:hypothetical protein